MAKNKIDKQSIDTVDKLIRYYKDGNLSDRQLITYVKNSKEYSDEIIKRTSFLDEYEPYDIIERLYYIVNDLTEIVKCKYCERKATWYKRGLKEGYRDICDSKECRSKQLTDVRNGKTVISDKRNAEFIEWQNSVTQVNDDIIKEHIKYDKFIPLITNPVILDYLNNRYKDSDGIEETLKRIELGIDEKPKCALPGCNNPVTFIGRKRALFSKFCCPTHSAQSKETREKCKKTNKEHWGTENVYDSEKYRQKMLNEFGVEYLWHRDDIKEKRNMTCLERYGTIYPTQIKEIMDKVRQTTFERYGEECMFNIPEVFELAHSTETIQKIQETNMNRYGCISPWGSDEVQRKIAETNKERYGEECILNLPEVKEKAHSPEAIQKQKETNKARYGCEWPFATRQAKQHSFEKMKENGQLQKSHKEDEVAEYIISLGYNVERHHMTEVFPFNADMYLPEYNLYIEYQGSHFHNTYSFMGTKEDFEVLNTYYKKSQRIKEKSGNDKLTQYDNMIYVWSDLDVRKRVYAQENHILYFEIYKQPKLEYIKQQLDFLLCCINKTNVFNISKDALYKEFNYFKNAYADELAECVGYQHLIIKQFQCTEFFKNEMEIFATQPNTRRKLIQNRCKYLNKKEWELTPNDILTGFKKSGIWYGYSHFNPLWTNWFVHKYNIRTVYDPCGGWGHHMLGMLSCEKIIYNDINSNVCGNIQEIKEFFKIDNLEIHNNDASVYIPETVDAFFMCPPYFNIEKYSSDSVFETKNDYRKFIQSIVNIWKESSAKIFGIIIREDLYSEYIKSLLRDMLIETKQIKMSDTHFNKKHKKKYNEYFYIFRK